MSFSWSSQDFTHEVSQLPGISRVWEQTSANAAARSWVRGAQCITALRCFCSTRLPCLSSATPGGLSMWHTWSRSQARSAEPKPRGFRRPKAVRDARRSLFLLLVLRRRHSKRCGQGPRFAHTYRLWAKAVRRSTPSRGGVMPRSTLRDIHGSWRPAFAAV